MKPGRVSVFFLPGSASECSPYRGCSCPGPGVSNWRLGDSGCQSPRSPGHPGLLWGAKAPQVWNGVTWTRSTLCSIGWEMGRGAVVQGGGQGMWCPLCACLGLLPALPSPSQGCVGLTGGGRWGASAVPLEVRGSPREHGRRMLC